MGRPQEPPAHQLTVLETQQQPTKTDMVILLAPLPLRLTVLETQQQPTKTVMAKRQESQSQIPIALVIKTLRILILTDTLLEPLPLQQIALVIPLRLIVTGKD